MAGVFDCGICDNAYDETGRKPLVLLCGHTYCQQCLHDVVSVSSPACPSCRKEIVSPVDELPVNFMLIPSSSGEAASASVASTKMFCNTHQNELDYWCSQCKVLICKRCLVPIHAKHEFILAEKIFTDEGIIPDLRDQVSANLLQVKASIHTTQQLESLTSINDELKDLIPMMKKALLKQESSLCNFFKVLEQISSESSSEQKNLVLKMLKDQNQVQLKEDKIKKGSVASTKMFCNTHQNKLDYWCSQCKVIICKRCLVQTHAKHEFILAEEIFADMRILPHLKSQIDTNLQQFKASIHNLQQLESSASTIDEVRSSIPQLKKALLKQESTLNNILKVMEEITSEPSLEQKNLVLKMLKDQNPMQFKEVHVSKALKPFQDQGVQCQISNLANGRKDKPIEKYMPDGLPWTIISNELAERALCTMKETDHQTPKATVISTDESPILCLPELLQYLAASSATMELQLMDRAVKNPFKKDWLPLKAGGEKSTDFNHCYRLKSLADSLVYFHTLAAASTTAGEVVNDAAKSKVIILVYPETRTYDVCVLAFGKVVKGHTGSWPLPLEVHVLGMTQQEHWEWVECTLLSLYNIAQPDMGECRVYLPEYVWYHGHTSELCSVLAELGKKFSTQHRLYLPGSVHDHLKPYCHQWAEEHKLALEFRDW